ncbi:MAG: hypothetical protein PHQ04_08085 [Opitutaceae bacterium]|nr:hypothetical protein [Opitutaceae bacterium]
MKPRLRHLILLLGGCTLACVPVAAAAPTPPALSAPIENFRIHVFSNDGYRLWVLRGSTIHPLGDDQFEVKDLELTAFSGDARNQVESVLLSPAAQVDTANRLASGEGTIRIIHYTENLEGTGTGWSYHQRQKRVSLKKNVSVTFRAELKDLLK